MGSVVVGMGTKKKGKVEKGAKGNLATNANVQCQSAKNSQEWFNGIMSYDQDKPPCHDLEDTNGNPILSIPLIRVHVCSLHARLKILEKLFMLHGNYAWNMERVQSDKSSL